MFAVLALATPLLAPFSAQLPMEIPLQQEVESGFERTTDFALNPQIRLPQNDWIATACFFTAPGDGHYVARIQTGSFAPLLAATDEQGTILNWAMPLPGQTELTLAVPLASGERIAFFVAGHPGIHDQAKSIEEWRFNFAVRASSATGNLERNSMSGQIHRVRSEERALREVEGETSTMALFAGQRLANLLSDNGNWVEALELLERTLNLRRKHYGDTHRATMQLMLAYGRALHKNGLIPQAQKVLLEVVELRRKHTGPQSYPYSNALYALGELQIEIGEREAGYQSILAAIEIQLAIPRRVVEAAYKYAFLAHAYGDWGQHDLAIPAASKALELAADLSEEQRLHRASICLKVGVYYLRAGMLDQAEPLLQQAFDLSDQGKEFHMERLAQLCFQTGVLHLRKGDFEKAEQWYLEARKVYLRSGGEQSPGAAEMWWEIAYLRVDQERLLDAQSYFQLALDDVAEIYGEEHPAMWQRLATVGALCERNGLVDQAAAYFLRSLKGRNQFLQANFPVLPEYQRFQLLSRSRDCESLLRCLVTGPDVDLEAPLTLYLSWKGKATRLQSAALLMLQAVDDPDVTAKRDRLVLVNRELSECILQSIEVADGGQVERLQSLQKERIQLEQEIALALGLDEVFETPAAAQVVEGVPENGVILDFFVGESVYVWVISSTGVRLIPLGSALEMEDEQRRFLARRGVRGGRSLETNQDQASKLPVLLWQPLRDAVAEFDQIWVCPDGFLSELAFGVLPQADHSRYLIEKHRFQYLTDATQILNSGTMTESREGKVLAVGGVNYFKREKRPVAATSQPGARSNIGGTWAPLKGTKDEVESLQAMIEYVLEWKAKVEVLTGTAASEESVRERLPGNRYLHLATHGYFEPDHLPSLVAASENLESRADLVAKIEAVGMLPGLLAGLVFAGANREPEQGEDDGLLSAEEISYLDLSACDLAVLSACQTALGSRRAGEGLMSLRRAFHVAGAKSVVSSLWKIDDQASADLMALFYRNYLERGMSKSESLHLAKLQVLRKNRAEFDGDARPLTWGAFVLSGSWR